MKNILLESEEVIDGGDSNVEGNIAQKVLMKSSILLGNWMQVVMMPGDIHCQRFVASSFIYQFMLKAQLIILVIKLITYFTT